MKITKDEARILAAAVDCFKYEHRRDDRVYEALEELQNRLTAFGKDKRRNGRTSQDDYTDLLKRFTNAKR